ELARRSSDLGWVVDGGAPGPGHVAGLGERRLPGLVDRPALLDVAARGVQRRRLADPAADDAPAGRAGHGRLADVAGRDGKDLRLDRRVRVGVAGADREHVELAR